MSRHPIRHRSRGVVLIEALVALLIVAFAIVALGGVQANFIRSADLARQRGDALRLAQQDLESLRGYISLDGSENSFAAIANALRALHAADRDLNTDYILTRDVQATEDGRAVAVRVTVAWEDRAGEHQQVRLDSLIHRAEPALGFALGQAPARTRFAAGGRHPDVPPLAVNLGDGSSAYSPAGAARIVWLFNNATGALVSRCSLASGHSDKTSDPDDCVDIANGYLLSGTVNSPQAPCPCPSIWC